MRKIQEKFNTSLFLGELPRGCQFCHSGSKIVLFMTGMCEKPNSCRWYCPISFERRGNDLSFVNEVQITSDQDVIEEAKIISAEGAAITGGEPLFKFEKTLHYIKLLKRNFGENFHIHLYTNGIVLTKSHLKKLRSAGLDEIRLHPIRKNWEKVKWAISANIDTGVEIPAIPIQFPKLKALVWYLDRIGAFLNLNEFEITESNAQLMKQFGYSLKKDTIAAVTQSEEFGLKILNWAKPFNLSIHYCSIGYKDGIQLKMRYLRRAKNIAGSQETVNQDGLIMKAIAYNQSLKNFELKTIKDQLINKFGLNEALIVINTEKNRIEIALNALDTIKNYLKKRNFTLGIIEELPLSGKNRIQMTFTPV